jgi:hypothetical protein
MKAMKMVPARPEESADRRANNQPHDCTHDPHEDVARMP